MITEYFSKHIKHGTLILTLQNGKTFHFGKEKPVAHWRMLKKGVVQRVILDPEMELGQTYMDGGWDTGDGDLQTLMEVLMRNFPEKVPTGTRRLVQWLIQPLQQLNRINRSKKNVEHHYNMDESLYRMFLDEDMQYSCAYYRSNDLTLEQAQRAKCQHIMNKLELRPGQRVLDIGCGWGGLALYLAENAGVKVTGITLSSEQLRVARQRAHERGLGDRVSFHLEDYRQHKGEYDAIVSVGMFEHVGQPNYKTFFKCVKNLLSDSGVALLHTIGRFSPPGAMNPWIRKYIFPGGYIPAASELLGAIEKNLVVTTDLEVLRIHYARTLTEWIKRFQAKRKEITRQMDERFYRMWEFYLHSCEGAFRWRDLVVFQVQLAKNMETVPITRDHLYLADKTPASVSLDKASSGASAAA